MGKSSYAINAALNAFLRATNLTAPTTVYVALFNGDPAGAGSEVSGGSYARQSITFGAPSSGTCTSTNSQTFSNMPATTVSYVAIFDASTAGNRLYSAAATTSKTTNSGDTVTIASGGITVSES
jgi:hypothetical protein